MGKRLLVEKGFTIIELIVVIAIIAVLSGIMMSNFGGIMESANVSGAGSIQRAMTTAVEMYHADMGFYPPDVNRGWDPGLVKPLPWSPDPPSSGGFSTSGENCINCPEDWKDIVAQNWKGPYLSQWPASTPWGGKYDYNYWIDTSRYGCPAVDGIYIGVERGYDDLTGALLLSAEEKMANYGFDSGCTNGEAQMLLIKF